MKCGHHRNTRELVPAAPKRFHGLVYSQQTTWFHGGNEDHTLGWYQALVEARTGAEIRAVIANRVIFDRVRVEVLDIGESIVDPTNADVVARIC